MKFTLEIDVDKHFNLGRNFKEVLLEIANTVCSEMPNNAVWSDVAKHEGYKRRGYVVNVELVDESTGKVAVRAMCHEEYFEGETMVHKEDGYQCAEEVQIKTLAKRRGGDSENSN